jgi:hypothetical protein
MQKLFGLSLFVAVALIAIGSAQGETLQPEVILSQIERISHPDELPDYSFDAQGIHRSNGKYFLVEDGDVRELGWIPKLTEYCFYSAKSDLVGALVSAPKREVQIFTTLGVVVGRVPLKLYERPVDLLPSGDILTKRYSSDNPYLWSLAKVCLYGRDGVLIGMSPRLSALSVASNHDGSRVAINVAKRDDSSGLPPESKAVHVYDLRSGRRIHRLPPSSRVIQSATGRFHALSGDGLLRLFEEGKRVVSLALGTPSNVAHFSDDERFLIVPGTDNGSVTVLNTNSLDSQYAVQAEPGWFVMDRATVVNSKGQSMIARFAASGGGMQPCRIDVYDTDGVLMGTCQFEPVDQSIAPLQGASFSEDGEVLLILHGSDGILRVPFQKAVSQ